MRREHPSAAPRSVVKIRIGQSVPSGEWDEVVVAIGHGGDVPELGDDGKLRLALPVFTKEGDFNRLRGRVKMLMRAGFRKWEAADLAGLRMLRSLGVDDVTADWTLYAFNSLAAAALAELGVVRCVISPESDAAEDALSFPIPADCLVQQSTPLFISLTRPAAEDTSRLVDADGGEYTSFLLDGLWTTTRLAPRTFTAPAGAGTRLDLSWDPVLEEEP